MAPAEASSTLIERVQGFVSENKRAVIIGTAAAVLAVGGVAYYASTSRGPGADLEKGKGKGSKKGGSSSGSKKRKTVKDDDGPILEEITKTEEGNVVPIDVWSSCCYCILNNVFVCLCVCGYR
jgi:mitochondrial import receptor subunit TOM70